MVRAARSGWRVRARCEYVSLVALGYRRPMPSTGDRRRLRWPPPGCRAGAVLAGLVGAPGRVALAACTAREPQPRAVGLGRRPPAPAPPLDDAADRAARPRRSRRSRRPPRDALALLAAYEATVAAHPTLGAGARRRTRPTTTPTSRRWASGSRCRRRRRPTSGPTGSTTTPRPTVPTGPSATAPPVPADPAAARAALVQAEQVTGDGGARRRPERTRRRGGAAARLDRRQPRRPRAAARRPA